MPDLLLVEDDVPLQHAIAASLRPLHLDVVAAETSEDAIEAVTSRRFRVVLLDLILRDFSSGYYVIDAIRRQPSATRPYVIVMTAAPLNTIANLDRAIVKAIFVKPVQLDVLAACVRAVVGEREAPPDETAPRDIGEDAERIIESLRNASDATENLFRKRD